METLLLVIWYVMMTWESLVHTGGGGLQQILESCSQYSKDYEIESDAKKKKSQEGLK